MVTQIRRFFLNLGTLDKNFKTTKYSLERSFQKEEEYQKTFFSKYFIKTLRSNLKFLMCIAYSVLSCKLATSFSTSLIFNRSGKMVNYYEVHVVFQDIEHQLQENILQYFLHHSFFLKSSLN